MQGREERTCHILMVGSANHGKLIERLCKNRIENRYNLTGVGTWFQYRRTLTPGPADGHAACPLDLVHIDMAETDITGITPEQMQAFVAELRERGDPMIVVLQRNDEAKELLKYLKGLNFLAKPKMDYVKLMDRLSIHYKQ